MNNQTFDFELVDKFTPVTVVKNALKQIEVATKGYVTGNIEPYSGHISSYTKKIGFAAAFDTLNRTETVEVDIQEDLGAQDTEQNRYEVFLSVKGLEHYKYRMMFVDYGTVSYPVRIVMNEDLAVEYSGKRKPVFDIHNMANLEAMMEKIINCVTFISLVQSLINESLRKEAEGQGAVEETSE